MPPSSPNSCHEPALSQHQIARDRPELRQALLAWLESWSQSGDGNASLELTLHLLLEQRRGQGGGQAELVWSGPQGGVGDITRDQAVLIREMVERCGLIHASVPAGLTRGCPGPGLQHQQLPELGAKALDGIAEAVEHLPDRAAQPASCIRASPQWRPIPWLP